MVQDLTNKVIWVTGATSGIGEAAAVHLSQQGARIVASGRRKERLQALAARLPSPHLTLPLDVADETAVMSTAKQIIEAFGRIDVLVHSAGLNITKRSWDRSHPAAGMKSSKSTLTARSIAIRRCFPSCETRKTA